jgi:uncharacterized tellurite resistance protein B-like protein
MQTIFNTPEEMTVHLAALRAIAEADGIVTDDERRYLENLEQIYKARFPELAEAQRGTGNDDLATLLGAISNQRTKIIFLQDLLSMASTDGVISPEEVTKIGEIADLIGIKRTELERLFALNRELLEANNRLAEFLFAN